MTYILRIGESTDRNLVGGKGASLSAMKSLGLNVPDGFTITTEAWRAVETGEIKFHALWKMVAEQLEAVFPDFGKGELVSVRSGAAQSMPGMMDTILNVGVTADHPARTRLNFWKSFAVASGVKRQDIDDAIDLKLASSGQFFVSGLSADKFDQVISAIRGLIKESGSLPTTSHTILKRAIQLVFDSWKSERAVAYRQQFGIADDLGTACTIQRMILADDGGSGVYLTRNPQTGEAGEPYIDFALGAQGDAVVDGSSPVSNWKVLKAKFPKQFEELLSIGRKLERHFKDAMDIEFTLSGGQLYILQCRAMKRNPSARPRIVLDMALDGILDKSSVLAADVQPTEITETVVTGPAKLVCSATPIVPKLVHGKATFKDKPKPGLIIIRGNTTTDDLPHMLEAAAVVTAVGGPTCHAALVARETGVPTFVGISEAYVSDGSQLIANNSKSRIEEGDDITITPDGKIYAGQVETAQVTTVDPNYTRLCNLRELLA